MKKTVFIVGAGASCDFGLPLGAALAEAIRGSLDVDFGRHNLQKGPIANALMRGGGLRDGHVAAAVELRGALLNSRSIDHALFTRRENEAVVRIGKLGIAEQILAGERQSTLPVGWTIDRHVIHEKLSSCRESWLAKVFRYLAADRRPEDYEGIFADVSFVTFNYDRCIEQYLFYALQDIGSLSKEQAADLVRRLPVVHVYGHLGMPHFMGGPTHTQFGAGPDFVVNCAEGIRTFTEGATEGNLARARELTQSKPQVVFLGFGFDPQNVEALFPTGALKEQVLWGTRMVDDRRFSEFISRMGPPHAQNQGRFVSETCGAFIDLMGFQIFDA